MSSNHPLLVDVKNNFSKIKPDYANIPLREGDSAYTENKAAITLCLKDPHTGTHYDMNTIMYVALHELAHMITPQQGHGAEFKKNFADLLNTTAYGKERVITYWNVGRAISSHILIHKNRADYGKKLFKARLRGIDTPPLETKGGRKACKYVNSVLNGLSS